MQDALTANDSDMQELLAALHSQGVQDRDIQTAAISVGQQTSGFAPPTVIGYSASDNVTVTVHHVQDVGPLIAAVVSAVGGDVTIGGVNLSVADPSAALSNARAAAMSDAAERPQQWASWPTVRWARSSRSPRSCRARVRVEAPAPLAPDVAGAVGLRLRRVSRRSRCRWP
jgi:uncharacterized protein YggE